MEIPRKPALFKLRNDHWPRVAEALYLLATTGISVRFELQNNLARKYGIALRSGSMRRIFEEDLLDAELIQHETLPTFGRHRLSVVQLTDEGRDLCQKFGWAVAECEWEHLQMLHCADSQPKHTGAVLPR